MPTITLNKQVIESLVGKKLPIEELKDRISMLGTDLEGIDGNDINIEIFPNRPDLLSEQGFARAFASFIGVKKGLQEYKVEKSGYKIIIDKSLAKVRPYTSCAIVKNLKFDDEKIREIIQIQEKLHVGYGRNRKKVAIGIYPMEKITFPITFRAEDPSKIRFQPLEFPREITGLQILSQHPTGREYGNLLEGYEKFPIFRDANEKVLSMPPIINSHDVGKISHDTTEVFIECSGFDYDVLAKCLNMIVTALADMGGKIFSLELNFPDEKITSPDLSPSKMKVNLDYVNKRLGLSLTEKQVIELLSRMGYGHDRKTDNVLIPAYRADVIHPIDLVEDIAIAYGYENFEEIIPQVATIGQESRIESLKRRIVELLIGLKITELYTYNISNDQIMEKKSFCQKPIMLANSISEDFNCLRSSMIPSLLDVLSRNKHNEYPQNVFDIGTVFEKDTREETNLKEQEWLSVALCDETIDFTRIKQVLDYLFSNLDLAYTISEMSSRTFIEGRCGSIKVNGKEIGVIGEINPEVLSNFSLEYPIAVLGLNINELLNLLK